MTEEGGAMGGAWQGTGAPDSIEDVSSRCSLASSSMSLDNNLRTNLTLGMQISLTTDHDIKTQNT